jgi:hypothetical protein
MFSWFLLLVQIDQTVVTPAAISAVAYGRPYSVCTETALNLYRLAAGEAPKSKKLKCLFMEL